MSIITKPVYEISIWDDVLTYNITVDGEEISKNVTSLPTNVDYVVNYQFFDEIKQAVIGANGMDSAFRAHNPVFTRNVNGSITLTFTMYSQIYDYDMHDYVQNPFIKQLTNERKIKLKYPEVGVEDPWYDLIIKNIQESSDNKTYSYTATSIAVNELSKNGYNIELDPELSNNQNTIVELGKKIVAGSDWAISNDNDLLRQWIEEPIYKVTTNTNLNIKPAIHGDKTSIGGTETIYMFYSQIADKQTDKVQIILEDALEKCDANNVIVEPDIYIITGEVEWLDNGWPKFAETFELYTKSRAQRLEYRQNNIYDEVLGRNVYEYTKEKQKYYGYTEADYISPQYVRNLITNGSNFMHTSGWHVAGDVTQDELEVLHYPKIPDPGWKDGKSYLHFKISNKSKITNQGIFDNRSYLKGIIDGQNFILRIAKDEKTDLESLNFAIGKYNHSESDEFYLSFVQMEEPLLPYEIIEKDGEKVRESLAPSYDYDFVYYKGTWNGSLTEAELSTIIPTFYITTAAESTEANIRHIELFEELKIKQIIEDQEVEFTYVPGTISGKDLIIQNIHYIYPANSAKKKEDIKYDYKGTQVPKEYLPVYNDSGENGFEKIRSITGKESNRYNLIQSLCESFECWADFRISHDINTGKIELDIKDNTVRQKKTITFRKNVGKENHAGFRYGINLKSIQRTLDSNQLSSKVIVKPNSNELAEGGFCTIADAEENPIGENFLLCFDYYIQHGLLEQQSVTNDLYDTTVGRAGYLGYIPQVLKLNREAQLITKQSATLIASQSELEANQQILNLTANESKQLAESYRLQLYQNSNFTYEELIKDYEGAELPDDLRTALANTVNQDYIIQIQQYESSYESASAALVDAEAELKKLKKQIEANDQKLKDIRAEKDILNKKFYDKYARFIQEGTWTSEDYIDPNLYYLDAYNVAKTSAFPKVTYTINVIGLEGNEEYKGYSFNIGDLSYVEDTEFFGFIYKDEVKTPYREQVVVSERIDNLDSPESNQIKVQNYKTQFQDLFQRIEATNQAVEYSRGTVNRVSNIVNEDGTIKVDILQNSMTNNALIIQNAKNQSVIWGDQGIIATNLLRPNEIVRITSGGIMLSNDGGRNYLTGITANGINANYITSGQLDTGVLVIRNGSFPSFRWDSNGISAYVLTQNGYVTNQYVRYDQYGLYGAYVEGINFEGCESWEDRINAIKDQSAFSLTWKGFRLNNKTTGNGKYIDISSENDIRVIVENDEGQGVNRVKIGNVGTTTEPNYGLAIYDNLGNSVLQTEEDGKLWLKQELNISSSGKDYSIGLGYLDGVKENTNIHETLNVSNKFFVYEDGSIKATEANITGHINATSGKIGNMDIAAIDKIGTQVVIIATEGTIFKEWDGTILEARLMQGDTEIVDNVSYEWILNGQVVGTGKTYEVPESVLNDNSTAQYTCRATLSDMG